MKTIAEFPNYKVSPEGRIYNFKGKEIKRQENKDGYWVVNLYLNGKSYHRRCARLVGLAYLEDSYFEDAVINHKDLNVKNDHVSNLEWVTVQENAQHSIENQPSVHRKRTDNTEEEIHEVCRMIQDGVRNKEILQKVNITKDVLLKIRCKQAWLWISKDYKLTPSRRGISEETAKWVCHKIKEGLSNKDIMEAFNGKHLSIYIIKAIRNKRTWLHISKGILD